MSHIFDIPFSNTNIFTDRIRGGINVMHVLNSDVEDWLNESGSEWEFVDAGHYWEAVTGLQIWHPYRQVSGEFIKLPPGQIKVESDDVALLFKLTWLGA